MARWSPCKRRAFIRKIQALGFSPPEPGGRHFYVRYGAFTLALPNNDEYSVNQVKMLVREVERTLGRKMSLDEWQDL